MIAALEEIDKIDVLIEDKLRVSGINELKAQRDELEAKVKEYALAKGNVEEGRYKVTVVRGFRRHWDGEKLAKLVPKGIFLKIVDYVPNADKIDELVKEKKLDAKKIGAAFIETPNNPYVKITKATQKDSDEAERVKAALA